MQCVESTPVEEAAQEGGQAGLVTVGEEAENEGKSTAQEEEEGDGGKANAEVLLG